MYLDAHTIYATNGTSGRALSEKCFAMMKALNNPEKTQFHMAKKGPVKLIKCMKIAHFFFPSKTSSLPG